MCSWHKQFPHVIGIGVYRLASIGAIPCYFPLTYLLIYSLTNILCVRADVAAAPLDVQVGHVTRDSCTVTWSAPASDGGTPVVGYHVEQRLVSRPSWVRVGPTVAGTSFRVPGLFDGQTYQFRVTAETRAGLGDPSPASAAVTARDPWTRPGPPTMPQVSDVTRKSCRVSWLAPTDDGGDDIRGYVVEYKVRGLHTLPPPSAFLLNVSQCQSKFFNVARIAELLD